MKPTCILTIKKTLHLKTLGLLALDPDFSIPEGFPTHHIIEEVIVRRPDGTERKVSAQFAMSRLSLNISDPALIFDKRLRIRVSLLDTVPEEIPIGSEILVFSDLARSLVQYTV